MTTNTINTLDTLDDSNTVWEASRLVTDCWLLTPITSPEFALLSRVRDQLIDRWRITWQFGFHNRHGVWPDSLD